MIVDAHSHVYFKDFSNDFDKVLDEAKSVGVSFIVCNGLDLDTNKQVLELAKKYPMIKPALGLYPLEVPKLSDSAIEKVFSFIESHIKECVAIGEVGLDYTDKTAIAKQKEVLERFLALAKKYDKPIILHSRNAEADVVELVLNSQVKNAVFHCFSGKYSLVKKIVDNNSYITIPVNVVNSEHFQKIAKEVSLKQLLTETDAPYLGPKRGERNDPKNLVLTIKKISELRDLNVDEVEKILFMNAKKIFMF